jgi:hypothetical protein
VFKHVFENAVHIAGRGRGEEKRAGHARRFTPDF